MQSQLYSISKIFSERLFRIPDYQRGYAWSERQLKDFWNDIVQLEDGKNHYCGVITLEKVDRKKYKNWIDDLWIIESRSFEPYFVVDGQQRLTTTIILIQSITELFNQSDKLNFTPLSEIRQKFIFETKDSGISRSYIFGYEKDNPSYEFLKTEIFQETSSKQYVSEETIYTHNLLNAKNYFLEKLQSFTTDEVGKLFKKITQNILFNIYTIANDIDVFVAFETMNNRGKPLSHLELLKNRLIYLTTKMNIDDNDKSYIRGIINDTWKAVYHYLGKNKSSSLDDDEFLANHFLLYVFPEYRQHKEIRNFKFYRYHSYRSPEYAEVLFEEKFSRRRLYSDSNPLTLEEIKLYVESLQKSVIVWYNLHFPNENKSYTREEKYYLERINRLDFLDAAPLLLVLFNRKIKRELRSEILINIERYLFIDTLVYQGDATIDIDFASDAVRLLTDEIKIEDYNRHFSQSVTKYFTSEKVVVDIKRRIGYSNYYKWSGIRYFLFEYEKSLQAKTKNKTSKISWEDFNINSEDFVTVEHIYPQKAIDTSWKNAFGNYSLKNRRILCDSLGNLLALSKPKNSALQNKPFLEKIENSKDIVGYRYGSYSEIEVSKYTDWNPENILVRGLKLLDFMEEHWDLRLGTRKQKTQLLKLEFMI
jgi:uncharacterized protein with ParB-like and HNH nuclease domain